MTLEVFDGSPDQPLSRRPLLREPRGRGLLLVERATTRWGFRLVPAGKVVWCTLELDQAKPLPRPGKGAPVTTRLDLAESVADLLTYGPAMKDEIVQWAQDGGAAEDILDALQGLPDRKFENLRDLWAYLPDSQVRH